MFLRPDVSINAQTEAAKFSQDGGEVFISAVVSRGRDIVHVNNIANFFSFRPVALSTMANWVLRLDHGGQVRGAVLSHLS